MKLTLKKKNIFGLRGGKREIKIFTKNAFRYRGL